MTGNQRPEDERGDMAEPPRAPELEPPTIALPRFPATIVDLFPPVHEPSSPPDADEPATIALPYGPPPQIAVPRFPATIVDLFPPTGMEDAPDLAPSELDAAGAATAEAPDPPPATPARTLISAELASESSGRFFSRDDQGRWLDRYELITEIASGLMAKVFLARLQGAGGFQRLVAIKKLHTPVAADPNLVETFIEEARIAAQIHHTHAVPILEIGSSSSGYYLVMEYIEGVTLAQLAGRVAQSGRAVPREISLRLILDALAGLSAAHELTDESGRPLGVVHRDVSPQNILIGVDGASRITDFGVARTTAQGPEPKTGSIKGKVAYLAPEQIRQEALDRRADLFSVGVILWEMLAGRSLFRADTKFDTIVRVLTGPVPRLRTTVVGISDALDALVAKALARPLDERFQSAVEMAEAIERAAEGSIATSREVATFVLKLFSRELNERRAGIRSWLDAVPVSAPNAMVALRGMPAASVVTAPSDEEGTAADFQAPPESVTVPRQLVGNLAPIPFEGEDPVELPMGGPLRSRGRRAIMGAVIVAVVGIVVFGVVSRGTGTAAGIGEPTAGVSASASASTSTSTSTTTTTTTTAVVAAAATAVASGVAGGVTAPSGSVHAAATSSAKAGASTITSGGGELENPYR